ncbi:hypothetical protein LQW54_000544 [Pestalotiopsis sp. IQ-011]
MRIIFRHFSAETIQSVVAGALATDEYFTLQDHVESLPHFQEFEKNREQIFQNFKDIEALQRARAFACEKNESAIGYPSVNEADTALLGFLPYYKPMTHFRGSPTTFWREVSVHFDGPGDEEDLPEALKAVSHEIGVEHIQKMRDAKWTLLNLTTHFLNPGQYQPLTAYGWLKLATVSSPIIKYILYMVDKKIISATSGDFSKVLITEGPRLIQLVPEAFGQETAELMLMLHLPKAELDTTLRTRSLSNTVTMSRQPNQTAGQKPDAFSEGCGNRIWWEDKVIARWLEIYQFAKVHRKALATATVPFLPYR